MMLHSRHQRTHYLKFPTPSRIPVTSGLTTCHSSHPATFQSPADSLLVIPHIQPHSSHQRTHYLSFLTPSHIPVTSRLTTCHSSHAATFQSPADSLLVIPHTQPQCQLPTVKCLKFCKSKWKKDKLESRVLSMSVYPGGGTSFSFWIITSVITFSVPYTHTVTISSAILYSTEA